MNLQSSTNSLLAMAMGATAYTSNKQEKIKQKNEKVNQQKQKVVDKAYQLMNERLAEARKLRGMQKQMIEQKREKYMDPAISGDRGTYFD